MKEFEFIPASLGRRLAALVYDVLLLFAVLIIASTLALPFTGGKGLEHHHPLLTLYFLGVIFLFNGWFWTHGGQTLGMRAWRIQILSVHGTTLSWWQVFIRFLLSLPFWCFILLVVLQSSGKGNVTLDLSAIPSWILYLTALAWLLIEQQPNNWRDRLGRCRVRYFDKNKITG